MKRKIVELRTPTCLPYRAYLLRLWRTQCKGEWQWRASIENRCTGERQVFGSLEQLFAFLSERCATQDMQAPGAQEMNV